MHKGAMRYSFVESVDKVLIRMSTELDLLQNVAEFCDSVLKVWDFINSFPLSNTFFYYNHPKIR